MLQSLLCEAEHGVGCVSSAETVHLQGAAYEQLLQQQGSACAHLSSS